MYTTKGVSVPQTPISRRAYAPATYTHTHTLTTLLVYHILLTTLRRRALMYFSCPRLCARPPSGSPRGQQRHPRTVLLLLYTNNINANYFCRRGGSRVYIMLLYKCDFNNGLAPRVYTYTYTLEHYGRLPRAGSRRKGQELASAELASTRHPSRREVKYRIMSGVIG